MTNFYSIKKTTSPYKVTSTKNASAYNAYSSNKKQNNVYSNSIGIFDKEYQEIQSYVADNSATIPVVPVEYVGVPSVSVDAPSVVPSAAPSESVNTTEPVQAKQSTSKKKNNNSVVIVFAILAVAAILLIPGKKHK